MHRLLLTSGNWPLIIRGVSPCLYVSPRPSHRPRLDATLAVVPRPHRVHIHADWLVQTVAKASAAQSFAHAAIHPANPDSAGPHHGAAIESQPARGRSRKGRPKRYSLLYPPTNLLVQRLRKPIDHITTDTWTMSRMIAGSKSSRLAVLAHQFVLRQDESIMETDLTELLATPLQWRKRLNKFAMKGIHEDDVRHWIWILAADDTDTKVDRLIAHDRFIPIFVLMAILRSDEHMLNGSSIVKIYDYIAKTYIGLNLDARKAWKEEVASGIWGRTLDSMGNMTPVHFMAVTGRLVYHCLTTFPSSLPMIAHLMVSYIRLIPDKMPISAGRRTGYAIRSMLFNHALRAFRRMPRLFPLANLPHNWKAQKILLGYSAGLSRPLVIDRWSYRAIRVVLMGLKKSEAEKLAASRYAKTWPPYIKQLDGTDEARDRAQYLSRSVKAGILAQSEGYSHDVVDHAIDTLGGFLPGRSVTIQTRSRPLGLWRFRQRNLQILAYWAAKVKATRNAYEAWQVFHEPPMAGVTPDFQVYAEMFSKLYVAEIDGSSTLLPGDAKETYPPHLANLTELERERVRPCSAEKLYERMLQSGQRPVHHCLTVLIRNAPSVHRAAQYLIDSPLHKDAVHNMTKCLTPAYQQLLRIPLPIFDSYIALLCSRQARRRWVPNPNHTPQPEILGSYNHLKRAIQLVCARLGPRRKPAVSPWHTVMRALANARLVMRPYVSWAEDDVAALKTMVDLFNAYKTSQGLHPVPFDCLCRCILKILRDDRATSLERGEATRQSFKRQNLAAEAQYHTGVAFGMAKSAFAELIAPVQAPLNSTLTSNDALPRLHHELSASHIHTYLQVLAKFGDVDEGVRVMEWLLATTDRSGVLDKARDPGHKQWVMMRNAIICFQSIVETSNVKPEAALNIKKAFQELEARGGTWSWPKSEDVEDYIRWRDDKYEEGNPS